MKLGITGIIRAQISISDTLKKTAKKYQLNRKTNYLKFKMSPE